MSVTRVSFVIASFILIATSAISVGLPTDDSLTTSTDAIRATLDAQVKAWNNGDIPSFMDGYVRSDELRFASGDKVQNGWQSTLDRYKKNYASRELMGQLTFSDLQIMVLSDDYAEVFGRFTLKRDPSVGDATGLFTLLMQRDGQRWLVRHDHTSAAQ